MNYYITGSPHIRTKENVKTIMLTVVISLVPVIMASIYFFKWFAVKQIIVSTAGAISTELVFKKFRRQKRIGDGSALITGIILALTLPPTLPLWATFIGGVFAISIGKQVFGGLGYNIFNPALIGRAFLMASFPVLMTTWVEPFTLDAVTKATPLALMKFAQQGTPWIDLVFGNVSGSCGETSAIAIFIGAIILLVRRIIDPRIPAGFLGSVTLLSTVLWLINPGKFFNPLSHLLSGGLLFGAFFMATDYVTSPVTKKGRWIFSVCCGIIVMIIRLWGGLPEGVMYSILIMNGFTPLINRLTVPKVFGK